MALLDVRVPMVISLVAGLVGGCGDDDATSASSSSGTVGVTTDTTGPITPTTTGSPPGKSNPYLLPTLYFANHRSISTSSGRLAPPSLNPSRAVMASSTARA
jgi:hypothetical protein